jgi:hypothetical protein
VDTKDKWIPVDGRTSGERRVRTTVGEVIKGRASRVIQAEDTAEFEVSISRP